MSTLENLLLNEYPEPEIPEDEQALQQAAEAYRIKNDSEANWALWKIAKIRAQAAANEKLAQQEIARIEAWLKSENTKLERDEAFFTNLLAQYHRQRMAEDPRRKTLSLPAGKTQFRRQQPEFERDEQALLRWLKANEKAELIKIEEHPDWVSLKKQIVLKELENGGVIAVDPTTGEKVEGVTVIPKPDKFVVEVS